MTAEKVRSAQSQLENLKSLKSVVMGNANAFAKELSDARQKLDAISKAIADKQKVFHEKIQREEALKEAARTAEPAAEPKAAQEKTKQSEEKESKTVVEEKNPNLRQNVLLRQSRKLLPKLSKRSLPRTKRRLRSKKPM